MICSIAPGKIILLGEHFVVEGCPAIGIAVGLYARVCVEEGGPLVYSRQLGLIEHSSPYMKPYARIISEVDKKYGCGSGYKIYIDSEIPVGAGMGSSAAVNVALANSLLKACGVEFTREEVNRIAYLGEVEVHGKPSGIDNTLATYGGLLYYRKGEFKRLDLPLPRGVEIIIADTGVKRDTGRVVRDVLERKRRLGKIGEAIYEVASMLVESAVSAMENSDATMLGELMTVNHGLLFSMGASSWVNDRLVHKMLEAGAYGAKLSGAGRGGIVIGLAASSKSREIMEALGSEGVRAYSVKPDYEGVRVVS